MHFANVNSASLDRAESGDGRNPVNEMKTEIHGMTIPSVHGKFELIICCSKPK